MGLKDINLAEIGKTIAKQLPLIGSLLAGRAGEAVGSVVASVLGVRNDPSEIDKALKNDPEAFVKLRELEINKQSELIGLKLEAETNQMAEETKQLSEINKTMRAELTSQDPYNRRWRATFGYSAAFTWTIEALAFCYVLVFNTEQAKNVGEAMAALTVMWTIALSVLGITVRSRSQDKQVAAGQTPTNLFQSLFNRKNNQ